MSETMNEIRAEQEAARAETRKEPYSFFPITIRAQAGLGDAQEFIEENFEDFFAWLVDEDQYTIYRYIKDNEKEFTDYVLEHGLC